MRYSPICTLCIDGTRELADVVSQEAAEADVMLLENHGILTTGPTL